MTQDGNLRGLNEWAVTKYDSLDRSVQTGIYNASTTYTLDQMQQNLNSDQNYPESFTVNTQNYYDDYLQVSVPPYSSSDVSKLLTPANSYPDPVTQVNQTRGLVTTSMVRMLEFPTILWLTTVNYYDEKGRVIQTNRVNSLTGGFDTTTMKYDFSGKLLSSYERYNNPLSVITPRTTVLSSTQYDHMGRVVQTTRQVNDNGVNKVVSKKAYDALGRLNQDTLGNNIESLNYNYNIRGWLRGINQGYITGGSNHYFGMELNYDYGFGTPQYNGNIAGIKWKSVGSGIARAYGYLYDNVNRLIAAPFYQNDAGDGTTFVQDGKIDFSVPQISYDPNGNILTMNQKGLEVTSSAPIDQLTYAYSSSSNQLQSVTDAAPVDTSYHLGDFQDGNTSGNDYFYDANGNLGKDLNKKIDSIRYNYLNLPEYIHINGKGNINYAYDASGTKFLKIVTDSTRGGKMDTTIYMDAAVYHSDTLQFVNEEEGRIRYMNKVSQVSGVTLTGMVYDYFLKDHLGDTRMVLTEEQDTTIYVATMEPKNAAIEDQLFNNVSTTQAPVPTGFEPSSGADTSNHYVSKLWGATGGNRVGPSIVLKVMANDTISANVFGWYQGAVQPPPSQEVPLINDLLTTLSSDVVGQGGSELSGAVSPVTSALSLAMGSFITTNENPSYVTTAPKAFLNWVLFDDQLNYVTGNAAQIPAMTAGESKQLIQGTLPAVIPKNGYLYIYVSNESQDTVFFDNLNINYRRGPVSEEEHYYPFGLTMSGISDRALQFGKNNHYKYNKGSELEEMNFSDGSGLEWYDTQLRELDPQIGRWNQIDSKPNMAESPYAAMGNNPIFKNDPLGDTGIVQGIADGFTGFFKGVANTVTHPVDALKSAVSPANLVDDGLNLITTGLYGATKQAVDATKTVIDEGAYGAGKVIGNTVAQVGVMAVGEGVGKVIGAAGETAETVVAKTPGQLGKEGMAATGITQNTEAIPSTTGKAAYRVPDQLDHSAGVIGEVKNVKSLSYTSQIQDYVHYANQTGYQFNLYIRQSTQLTAPLVEQVSLGNINLQFIPGSK